MVLFAWFKDTLDCKREDNAFAAEALEPDAVACDKPARLRAWLVALEMDADKLLEVGAMDPPAIVEIVKSLLDEASEMALLLAFVVVVVVVDAEDEVGIAILFFARMRSMI